MEILIAILFGLSIYLFKTNLDMRKELKSFLQTLNNAIDGKEIDTEYDEREISKLKSLLIKFINSNQVREQKVNIEKEKTKALISDISHQLKTPLANLQLYLELLEKNYSEEYIEVLKSEIHKLNFLIGSLVESSRLETDMIKLRRENVYLDELVKEVLKELEQNILEKDIEVNLEEESMAVELDRRWTKEAIHNLLENSIKYSPNGGRIAIRLFKSHIFYNLDITNDSENLNDMEKAQIFQRFYRGHNSRRKDGLGLGLFITKEIIEKQNGILSVESKDYKTTFRVDFPV